jgi:hypothetical protein
MRYVIAFGRFWYEFLIGDRPELFVGPLVALAVTALVTAAGWSIVSGLLLFCLVIASLAWALVDELGAIRVRGDG